MDEEKRYEKARERVQEIRGFYIHLMVYVIVNFGIFLFNMLVSRQELWFYWPLMGWGVGLGFHALFVFGPGRILGPEWEERKIQEILRKEEKERT
jgi:hypothetical protein